jgi:hypothetical protein
MASVTFQFALMASVKDLDERCVLASSFCLDTLADNPLIKV